MRYFATIRVELPVDSPEDAVKVAEEVTEKLNKDNDYDLNPYLCYVTSRERFKTIEILNNID